MLGGQYLTQLLLTTVVVFLFAGSLLGLALGAGLILRSRAVLPFIQLMNQWVSTRQVLKSLELPLQMAPAAAGARWFGALLVALGAFSTVILVARLDMSALATLLKAGGRASLTAIALDATRWFLVLGSLVAVVTGVMLLFFPRAWRSVEARANHWYSTRQLEISGDAVHLSLDRVVEAFPRAAGIALLVLSLIASVSSGMLLLGR